MDAYGDLSDLQILESDPAPPPAPAEISSSDSESLDSSSSNGQENAEQTSPAGEAAPSPGETQTSSPESKETTQSTLPEKTAEPEEDLSWATPILNNPELGPKFKQFQEHLKTYETTFGSVANARAIQQLGGVEAVKQLKAVNEGISAVDKV